MKLLSLFFILLITSTQASAFSWGPEAYHSRIEVMDLSRSACLNVDARYRIKDHLVVGVSRSSTLAIRVDPGPGLYENKIKSVALNLISPRLEIIQLKSPKIMETREDLGGGRWSTFEKPRQIVRSYFVFVIDSENFRSIMEQNLWQLQVTVTTAKEVVSDTQKLVVLGTDQEFRAFIPAGQCQFSTDTTLASELKYNPDRINDLGIEFTERRAGGTTPTKQKEFGIVELSSWENPVTRGATDKTTVSVGASLFIGRETYRELLPYFEVGVHFTLPPLAYGYIVRQDMVTATPYKTLTFGKCGVLELKNSDISWERDVRPAYTLMSIDSVNFNNKSAIDTKLATYPKYNTCKGRP